MKHRHKLIPVGRGKIWLRQVCTGARRAFLTIREFTMAIWIGIVSFHVLMIFAGYGSAMGRAADAASVRDTVHPGSALSALKVGDTIPDLEIRNIINYKTGSANISDFKTRLIILDFWSTYCSSCIPSLKKIDSLSKVFKGEVTFLPVTRQSSAIARAAWKKHGYSLPSATEDRVLQTLFPHKFLPHLVWILDGRVKATTSSGEVSADNIRAVLRSGNVALRSKADVMDYDPGKPLFIGNNGSSGKELRYYSMISASTPGIPAGGGKRTLPGNILRISYTNYEVAKLYQAAFKEADPLLEYPNRVLFLVSDSIRHMLVRQKNDPYWSEKSTFSYQLQFPGNRNANAFRVMQDDLNRFFATAYGFRGGIEKVEVNVLALVRQKHDGRLKASSGAPFRRVTKTSYSSANLPLSDLVTQLATVHSKLEIPIVDLTNFSAPVSLELDAGLEDLHALNLELDKYGLQLKEGKRVVDMLVFRTANNSNQ
ncbi:MAG TPA: hypothetical protein VGE15_12915 [Sphingobacteriaceae bacterium]